MPGKKSRGSLGADPAAPGGEEILRSPHGDLDADELRRALHRMADWAADYREGIEDRPIQPAVAPGDITARLPASAPDRGEPLERILADLDSVVMAGVLHWGHPAFLGYFGSTSNGPALLGEIAAAAMNVSAMTWRTSPAATELESVMLSWIRQMVGLPDGLTGVVFDTGSTALLHALAVAREGAAGSIRQRGVAGRRGVPVCRVYASDQAHSSLEKAMIMLGLGEENAIRVPSDDAFAMDVEALRRTIESDASRGLRPLAVVATVGSTSTASVDAVAGIASVCRAHGAWLHVDAAYGGAIGLLPEKRGLLEGVDQADSVVVNPHKWLFVPLDFSALYLRDPEAMRRLFALTPEYLRGDASAGASGGAVNYMDYGIQLGRRFRALKAWMTFRAFGRDGLAARVREHCRLAELLGRWIDAEPAFERSAPITMSVVCFRRAPEGLDADAADRLNASIAESVNVSGRAYLTHTRLKGRLVLRVGIGNIQTTELHVRTLWDEVRRAADRSQV